MTKVFQVDTGGTLTTGLVSYYPLSDGTDVWGGNNATNTNTTFGSGKVGNGGVFNGSARLVPANNFTWTQVSVAAWVNMNTSGGGYLFIKNSPNYDQHAYFEIEMSCTPNHLLIHTRNTSAQIYYASYNAAISTNTWHHVVGILDEVNHLAPCRWNIG